MNLFWIFVIVPAVTGLSSFFIKNDILRRYVWGFTSVVHFIMSLAVFLLKFPEQSDGWIGIDALSTIFLPLTSLLFLGVTWYGIGYIARERVEPSADDDEDGNMFFQSIPEAVFTGCLLFFLANMTFAILSRNFALQWVALEATTLTSTPLIYYHRQRRSLEAAWKYLIICSVGIALALLGVFFIDMSLPKNIDGLTVDIFMKNASLLNTRWLEISFIFLLVGYGTKMGLAPMHTWLPDAHSEAPSPVSALLSGALLNCAFLCILRLHQVCVAAGIGFFGQDMLLVFGLFSMGVAGVFILRSVEYKRMLAYSSVEHMGIIAVGIGLGGCGVFGSLFHAINHSLVKTMLFLTAGNILAVYHTKKIRDIGGLIRSMPVSGVLWIAGFFAIAGSPPFGTFISEFTILKTAVDQEKWVVSGLYLFFLSMVFIGMLKPFINMSFGKSDKIPQKEPLPSIIPQIIFIILALVLGLVIPEHISRILSEAAVKLGGTGL